ncbi:MAG: hypothetical protein RR348_03845, partial [Clostridia bacterium]
MKKKIVVIVAVVLALTFCFVGCQSTMNFGLEKSNAEVNFGEDAYEYLSALAGADLQARKA